MQTPAGLTQSISQPHDSPAVLGISGSVSISGSERMSLHQLARLIEQIQLVTREAQKLVAARSVADLTTRLRPDSWSVAECLDHLAQTTLAFLPALTNSIATAPRLATNRPLRTGLLAQLFIRNLEPPYRIRLKVLPQLNPQQQDFDPAWRGFLASQSQLSEAIFSAAGLAVDKVTIKSPVYARVSYNIYGAFRMLAAHQRRHLWQIAQILTALDRRQA